MLRALAVLIALLALAGCGGTRTAPALAPVPPASGVARVLGEAPLCEASGALWVACEDAARRCLLVADNERRDALFLFDIDGDRLVNQRPVPLRGPHGVAAIKDAEGLAGLGDDVVVIGSHSRRTWDTDGPRCTLDAQRLAFGRFAWRDGALVGSPVRTALDDWQRLLRAPACRQHLIAPATPAGAALADPLCAVIEEGQARAEHSRAGCAQGMNFEGVAVLGDAAATARVWLGLRGPRLDDGRAVLLRLASLDALRFDAVATLALAGDGVRDLAAAGDWLWILSGPSADAQDVATLWRVRADALRDGAALRPEIVQRDLPPFSEAIALAPDGSGAAFLLVDGDEERGPGDANGCPIAARYLPLTLPTH